MSSAIVLLFLTLLLAPQGRKIMIFWFSFPGPIDMFSWLIIFFKVLAVCGDGVLDPGEECDDGNLINNDFCSNNCTLNVCGNGRVGIDFCPPSLVSYHEHVVHNIFNYHKFFI